MVLYVATKNQGKIREINKIMESAGIICKSFPDMEDVEETGSTFEENAKIKADFLSSKLKDEYVIADDSGLSVDALNGAPGIYSARYSGTHGDDKANNLKVLKEMQGIENRQCRFICAIALSKNGKTVKTFHGELEGIVGYEERGKNGFGYDSIFLLPNGKTTAGIALSYADGNINGSNIASSTKNDAEYYGASLYGRIDNGDSAILGDISYMHSDNDITQNNSGHEITASADADAFSIGIRAEQESRCRQVCSVCWHPLHAPWRRRLQQQPWHGIQCR